MPFDSFPLSVEEAGSGRPVLVLHGGGGPLTVRPIHEHVAASRHVLTPTLPGWDGTDRPAWLTGVDDLVLGYRRMLRDRDLSDVLVVGSSIGGWLAAELAVADLGDRISGVVLLDAAGLVIPEVPLVDFFGLSPREIAEHAFADPDRFFVDPASLTEAQRRNQADNLASLRVIAGDPYMHDPKLARRLAGVGIPFLVVWGESDRVIPPPYGRAYADALPDARLEMIAGAGHLPQVERPRETFALIDAFAAETNA